MTDPLVTVPKRGRPPQGTRAMTDRERKRAQRMRDRRTVIDAIGNETDAPLKALLDLLGGSRVPNRLAKLLDGLGWLSVSGTDSGRSRNEERPPERLKEGPVGTSGPASFDGRSHARGRLFDLERGQEDRGIKGPASSARLCRESLLTPWTVPMLASSCRRGLVHPRQLPRGERGAWGGAPGWDTARTPSQNITVREHQNIKSGDHTQEREKSLELSTYTLARYRSTN
jgi:hypothetical protein